MPRDARRPAILQGTLDLLILRTLLFGPLHGHGITKHIQRTSEDVLQVEHGSLYPALYRLEKKGLVKGEWNTTENNREAKYYRLTAAGERALAAETADWRKFASAMDLVLVARS